jgi:uncharacterized membrane protein
METPQVDEFVIWLASIVIAVTAIAGGLVGLHRLLTGSLNKRLDDIGSQLKRNGGSSLRDAVDRIEEKQTVIQRDVRDLRQRLDDHIAYHLDKEL